MNATPAEIDAFASSAARGDVLPACMRLAQARSEHAWIDRLAIALSVAPACPPKVLDVACNYMPRSTEPRLLRALASLRLAAMARDDIEREAHNAAAREDLFMASAIDPHDDAVHAILVDVLGH